MPRKGENIRLRADGRWEGRFSKGKVDGKYLTGSVYGKSYRDVRDKLVQAKASYLRSKANENFKEGSFTEAAKLWLDYKSVTAAESTIVKYEDILRWYVFPAIGELDISSITQDALDKLVSELPYKRKDGSSRLSYQTVRMATHVVRSVFEYAARNRYVVNVCMDNICEDREDIGDIVMLSRDEEKILIDFALSSNGLWNLGIVVCLFTGLRIGELCALRWNRINLDEGYIHVTETMQRIRNRNDPQNKTFIKIGKPKSRKSIRKVPICTYLRGILAEHSVQEGFLLTGRDNLYVEPRQMERYFYKALKDCGLPRVNFHSLRHLFATTCVEAGMEAKTLSEILGHASVAFTLDRYYHPSIASKRKNIDRLSDLLGVK